MMDRISELVNFIFDPLHYSWEHKKTQKIIAGLLILVFVISLAGIELKRNGVAFGQLSWLPSNPFYAVQIAFSLLLIFEVLSLIFVLPCSVSRAVAKQFEILSLIFLRNCFKQLINFSEPIQFANHGETLLRIGGYALGALIIFALVGFFYAQENKREDERGKKAELFYFVAAKKAVALLLLLLFTGMGAYNLLAMFSAQEGIKFFREFYTVLIFSDILLVLVAHRFFPGFRDIFRNSAYTISTLLMRLCLTAPPGIDVLIGVGAAVYAVALAYVYRRTANVSSARF